MKNGTNAVGKVARNGLRFLGVGLCALTVGCASGPSRRQALGNWQYGTVTFTRQARPALKPLAAPAGVLADAGIVVADTFVTPALALGVTYRMQRDLGDLTGEQRGGSLYNLALYPIVYPLVCLEMGFGKNYEELFTECEGSLGDRLGR